LIVFILILKDPKKKKKTTPPKKRERESKLVRNLEKRTKINRDLKSGYLLEK